MPETQLRCTRCKEWKDKSHFSTRPKIARGYEYNCRLCTYAIRKAKPRHKIDQKNSNRKQWLSRNYGITEVEFNKLLEEQDHKCAICTIELTEDTGIHQDHDHSFGYTRGILCRGCNLGLGQFLDNKESLQNAILYLEKWEP